MTKNPPNAMVVFKIAAVVSCLGLAAFAAALFWFSMGPREETPAEHTRSNIGQIAQALAHYRAGCHALPNTEQGLPALLSPPSRGPLCTEIPTSILDTIPNDAWNRPYIYESDGKTFTLTSYGRDGKAGGEGDDADIVYRGSP